MTDPETYEVMVVVTGPDGKRVNTQTSTVTLPAGAYRMAKLEALGRTGDSLAMTAALTLVPASLDDLLDMVRDDEGAAGGSSFRGLLPAGATTSEDDR